MIIDILNSNFKKLDILRKYTYCTYTEMFRGIGTFTIHARLIEENLYLMDKENDYYVLFDNEVMGKIENAQENDDDETAGEKKIVLTGRLLPFILTKRVVVGTLKFSGNTAEYVTTLAKREFQNTTNEKRRINFAYVYDTTISTASLSSIEKQVTGGYLWDEIEPVLEQDKLGLIIRPVVEIEHIPDGQTEPTNISKWDFIISAGKDRTKHNTVGNEAIVFSKSLNNINRTEYIIDSANYCNVAYVAGEGEESDRKWYEVYQKEERQRTISDKSGWDRQELWIDARDIQSETEDGSITESEYETLITQRADEKLSENIKAEEYSSTVVQRNKTYGKDYNLGDWVSVLDEELGKDIDAQITEVTRTVQGMLDITDVSFTYGKIIRKENTKQIASVVEKNTNGVKYLESSLGGLEKALTSGNVNEVVKAMFLAMHPVGDIIINVTGINPGDIYGGTWVAWGSGRVPVGVSTDTEFNTVEKTGGEKTHKLTISEMPNHNHGIVCQHTDGSVVSAPNEALKSGIQQGGRNRFYTRYQGGDGSHNNIQPYITCYMWKRTA